MLLLYANRHHILSGDLHTVFRQESNFLYHTHITVPGCRAIIQGDKKIIFLPDKDEKKILREGDSVSRDQVQRDNPTAKIYPLSEWKEILVDLYDGSKSVDTNIAFLNHDGEEEKRELKEILGIQKKDILSLNQSYRAIKSEDEIKKIKKAQQITLDAIDFATQDIQSGMWEYEIAAKLSYYYASKGYTESFPAIVATGENACTLHYIANKSKIQQGDLLLIDTGAYVDGYCGDCSRTLMITKENINKSSLRGTKQSISGLPHSVILRSQGLSIVQSVHNACVAYVKPGITMKELHNYAVQYFEQQFTKHNLQRGKEYFPHGIGHSIGLDVHDPLDKDRPLQKNMVITIEPGIYISEQNIGIRLENIVIITEDGAKII